jgi:hypothetical protein
MTLAIFLDGKFVAEAPDDLQRAYEKLAEIGQGRPGYEVLRRCPVHPDTSIVDCTICDPVEA